MKLEDVLGGLGRVSDGDIVRNPAAGLFPATSLLRTLGGHRYGRGIIRQIKGLFPEIGEEIEKIANVADSIENVRDALSIFIPDRYPYPDPCPRIPPFLKDQAESYSEEDAEDVLQTGDHIYVYRIGYSHHGIYGGNGRVFHYFGNLLDMNSAEIIESPLHFFADGDRIYRYDYEAAYSPEEIIQRAKSRLGERKYNAATNNCMSYATWCRVG